MALKIRCAQPAAAPAARPAPPRDTHLELREKNGVSYIRATTHDGKKYRLLDLTPTGVVLRRNNRHADLGMAVDSSGRVRVS